MKKSLAFLLVLVMVSVFAVPVIATETVGGGLGESSTGIQLLSVPTAPEGYSSLPYKTETFKRFRNSRTAISSNYLKLAASSSVVINPDHFPIYGDSALIGVHDNWGTSFYVSSSNQNSDTIIIGEDSTPESSANDLLERALKLSGADTRAVSFGFIPTEVLSTVAGVYYSWQERAVTVGDNAKVVLNWVDENGLVVSEAASFEHATGLDTTAYTDFNLTVTGTAVTFGGASGAGVNLAEAPERAAGLALLIGFENGERYYRNLVAGTMSNNRAALVGDPLFYDETSGAVTINFAAPVTANSEDVKLYNGAGEEVSAVAVWNGDATAVTFTATLSENTAYRVSTSKANGGTFANDVIFKTREKISSSNASEVNNFELYDFMGNKLATSAAITTDTASYTGTIDVTIWLSEGETAPKAVIPYINCDNSALLYGFNTSAAATNEVRDSYLLVNGATAIPAKSFVLNVGSKTNDIYRLVYNVNFTVAVMPAEVTAELSATDGVELFDGVTLSFSHLIENKASLAVKEGETDYTDFTVVWTDSDASTTEPAKSSVVITPNKAWKNGATYTVSVDEHSSIFGDGCSVNPAELSFTTVAEPIVVSGEITSDDSITAVGLLTPVKITFNYAIANTAGLSVKENGSDYTAFSAVWSADKKSVTISPTERWNLSGNYVITLPSNSSVLGDVYELENNEFSFTVTSQGLDLATILDLEMTAGDTELNVNYNSAEDIFVVAAVGTSSLDLTDVDFSAKLSSTIASVKIGGTTYNSSATTNIVTGTGIDISSADSLENAIQIITDNGLGEEKTYKLYCRIVSKSQHTFGELTDFQDAELESRPIDLGVIYSAGATGSLTPSTGNYNETYPAYSKIVADPVDPENKVLQLYNEGNFASGTANYTGKYASWVTKAMPNSFYQDSNSVVFQFDMYDEAGVFGNGRIGLTASNANNNPDNAAFSISSTESNRYICGTLDRKFVFVNNGSIVPITQEIPTNSWYTLRFTYNKTENGKIQGVFSIKPKGAADWTYSATAPEGAWNFTDASYLYMCFAVDRGANIYFDNFLITADSLVITPEILLSSGEYHAVDQPIVINFPIELGYETANSITLMKGRFPVEADYTWSNGGHTLTITPDEPLYYGRGYTLVGKDLVDILGNVLDFEKTVNTPADRVTAEISAAAGENINSLGLMKPVTVTFSHDISTDGRETIAVKKGEETYTDFTATWKDAKTVEIAPRSAWNNNATYTVTIGEHSSVFGEYSPVISDGLTFTTETSAISVISTLTVPEGQNKNSLDLFSQVTVSFSHAISDVGKLSLDVKIGDDSFGGYTATWTDTAATASAPAKSSVVIKPTTAWLNDKTYTISVAENASVFGDMYPVVSNVTFTSAPTPLSITGTIAAGAGENIGCVGATSPVVIDFNYKITNKSGISVTEGIANYTAFEAVWSNEDKTVTIYPTIGWTPGASYAVTLPENASMFGDMYPVVCDNLTFTVSSELAGGANVTDITFNAGGTNVTALIDNSNKEIYAAVPAGTTITTAVATITLSSTMAYVEYGETTFRSSITSNVVSGTIDLSTASATPVEIVVDNGLNTADVTYKIYTYIDSAPVEERNELGSEGFGAGNVGDSSGDFEVISAFGSSGSTGTPGGGSDTRYAKIAVNPTNSSDKVLEVYTTDKEAYAGWLTTAIPQKEYRYASKLILGFDVYVPSGRTSFQNGRFGLLPSTSNSVTAFQSSSRSAYINALGSKFCIGSWFQDIGNSLSWAMSSVSENTWYTYEFVYTNEQYNAETVGTRLTIRRKQVGSNSWEEVVFGTIPWNFKNEEQLMWKMIFDSPTTACFDNFKTSVVAMDIAPEIVATAGKYAADAGSMADITLKSAVATSELGNIKLMDANGREVPWTPEVSINGERKAVISVVPNVAVENGKKFTLSGKITDIYGNEIDISKDLTVMPANFVNYDVITVEGIENEMELSETTTVQVMGDGTAISANYFDVTSSDTGIVSVTKTSNGYTLKALKSGWVVIKTYSDRYLGVDGIYLVYVAKDVIADSRFDYSTTTELGTVEGIEVEKVNAGTEITIDVDAVAGDYGQKYTVVYNATSQSSLAVSIAYGEHVATLNPITIKKENSTSKFADASFVIPAAAVESGETEYTITLVPSGNINIVGVLFEKGIDVNNVNNVTSDNATAMVETLATAINKASDYNGLVGSVKTKLANKLAEQVEDEPFADDAAVKAWFTVALADAVTESNNIKNISNGDLGGGNNNSNSGTNGPSYSFGTNSTGFVQNPALETKSNFTDLGTVAWAKTAINSLYAAGIVSGVSETEFAPLNNVKREEFVKLIVEAFGAYDPFLKSTSFADVASGAWYESYINSAVQAGLVQGVSANEFGVGQNITREQMATILKRACDKYGVTLTKKRDTYFSDVNSISNYAADSVQVLAQAGVFSGIDGAFAPQQPANRAMAAQVVYLIWSLI